MAHLAINPEKVPEMAVMDKDGISDPALAAANEVNRTGAIGRRVRGDRAGRNAMKRRRIASNRPGPHIHPAAGTTTRTGRDHAARPVRREGPAPAIGSG